MLVMAIVLGMGAMAFAQDVEVYEERGLFGKGQESSIFGAKGNGELMLPEHGMDDDQDADGPLGTGIALLTAFGAAYLLSNKKKD